MTDVVPPREVTLLVNGRKRYYSAHCVRTVEDLNAMARDLLIGDGVILVVEGEPVESTRSISMGRMIRSYN